MILEISANPGQGIAHRHAKVGQMRRIADPGNLEQMGRADGPGGQNHLAARAHLALPPAPPIPQTDHPPPVQVQAHHGGMGDHR